MEEKLHKKLILRNMTTLTSRVIRGLPGLCHDQS